MDEFKVENLKKEFFSFEGISIDLFTNLLDYLGKNAFNRFISQAKEINKTLDFFFDKVKFYPEINHVQSELNPELDTGHFSIGISNGEFSLNLKMLQLFSLDFIIDRQQIKLIETSKVTKSRMKAIFDKICDTKFKQEEGIWDFSVFGSNEEVDEYDLKKTFPMLFYYNFLFIIGHELGHRFYKYFSPHIQERLAEIKNFINIYLDKEGLKDMVSPRKINDWTEELFSDYFGMDLAIRTLLKKSEDFLAYLGSILHIYIKYLCDLWYLKRIQPNSLAARDFRLGFDNHPPNKLRKEFLHSLLPEDIKKAFDEIEKNSLELNI